MPRYSGGWHASSGTDWISRSRQLFQTGRKLTRILAGMRGFRQLTRCPDVRASACSTTRSHPAAPSVAPHFFRASCESKGTAGALRHTAVPDQHRAAATPQQIKAIYEMKRKGAWNGKEDEFARLEQDIFAAQKEKRILAPIYLTK